MKRINGSEVNTGTIRDGISRDFHPTKGYSALCSLANSAYAPEIKKLLPHSITGAPSVGMGICEWGKVEFFNFGLPFLAIFSLKGPE